MLDEQGVCRWAVAAPGHTQNPVPDRIVNAQYVATLDVRESGALVPLPRVGCPMLFAATDPTTGRIRLVRTPPLLRFEDRRTATMPRKPLVSKLEDELTPVVPASVPPPRRDRISSTPPPPSDPVPLMRRTPIPPRITGVQAIPVRVRAANLTKKRLARGK